MAVIIAILVAGFFLAGAVVGIIAIVSIGIRREERHFSLARGAPDQMSQGARLLTGLYVRDGSATPAATAWEDMLV
jgi:hypothetical protein